MDLQLEEMHMSDWIVVNRKKKVTTFKTYLTIFINSFVLYIIQHDNGFISLVSSYKNAHELLIDELVPLAHKWILSIADIWKLSHDMFLLKVLRVLLWRLKNNKKALNHVEFGKLLNHMMVAQYGLRPSITYKIATYLPSTYTPTDRELRDTFDGFYYYQLDGFLEENMRACVYYSVLCQIIDQDRIIEENN